MCRNKCTIIGVSQAERMIWFFQDCTYIIHYYSHAAGKKYLKQPMFMNSCIYITVRISYFTLETAAQIQEVEVGGDPSGLSST